MSVIIRILLRYGSGILIAKGVLPGDLGTELQADPELINALELGAGVLMGAISEGWYILARKFGWSK